MLAFLKTFSVETLSKSPFSGREENSTEALFSNTTTGENKKQNKTQNKTTKLITHTQGKKKINLEYKAHFHKKNQQQQQKRTTTKNKNNIYILKKKVKKKTKTNEGIDAIIGKFSCTLNMLLHMFI